ncbi:MAG: hypothetical protein HYY52_01155 [Candidatus Melainabacteria bacterium]|nr:hypothetical protein [Candidatus Melainabacteria bacterium]
MIKVIFSTLSVVLFLAFVQANFAKGALSGKEIFSSVKGSYGACNTCHPNGASAGRWDSELKEISADGDRMIPSLKGIGKRKTPEQLEKIIGLMSKKYKVPVTAEQIKALTQYVSGL